MGKTHGPAWLRHMVDANKKTASPVIRREAVEGRGITGGGERARLG